jgi:predicted phage terminase large subunit-like protein
MIQRIWARNRLLDFTLYTVPDAVLSEYRVWWHHRILSNALDRWSRGEISRLMVFFPPQTGKSELVSRRLPSYLLGRNPNRKILACSHSATLAKSMNRDVQRIVTGNGYKRLFPWTKIAETGRDYKRTDEYFEVVGRHGSLLSAGVGKGIAGLPAHVGIIDDPFGLREDAESETIRKKVWEWYTSDFVNRLSKDAPILITHTRWNRDDLAGRILLQAEDVTNAQWEVLCLPSLRPETPTHPDDPRGPGDALWPGHKSREDLEQLRRMDPRMFAAAHQQDPLMAGAEWPPEWFGPDIWFDEWPAANEGQKVIALDSSKGKGGRTGDDSAFALVQFHQGVLYCDMDARNDRNASEIADTAVELQKRFGAHAVVVEEEFGGHVLGPDIVARAQRRGVLMSLDSMTTGGIDKTVRIRRLTPYLSPAAPCAKLRFKSGSPGSKKLVDELREFPQGKHDDCPDALEMAIRRLVEGGAIG